MPVPLLNLPTDLVEEIFNLCNPLQLFVLSSCSKRTRKLVKSKVANKWKISSLTSTSIYLKGNRREEYRFKIDEYPKNCYCLTVSIMGSILHLTYPNEAVAQLLEDLVDVFGCRRAPFIKASAFNDFEKFLDLCRVVIKKNLEVRRVNPASTVMEE
ncbi:Protein CBG18679 [Caenorhabditis briggsae]|uniref:Protein CBG18679 n=2 Tax=Caenorhabditis briggsae TaxID=6238 RepID=A8XTX7_CAEBR|nr:Protein CBG18679 [Caenorhabditis briggsae]CAP36107.2 Protein CBG18679 [Caenorhabditis briggsae]